jgi:hypothetical protein
LGKGLNVPQSVIDSQTGLQNQEKYLLGKYSDIALPLLGSAGTYWSQLLQGGPAAQAATAPYAQTIAGQTTAAQKQIQQNLPAGGEKNLALAELPISQAASVANLYQGLGPTAASQIGSLALGTAGAGTGSGAVSSGAGSSLTGLAGQQQAAKGGAIGGLGQGIGTLAGGALGSKGSGSGALGGKAAGTGLGKAALA